MTDSKSLSEYCDVAGRCSERMTVEEVEEEAEEPEGDGGLLLLRRRPLVLVAKWYT